MQELKEEFQKFDEQFKDKVDKRRNKAANSSYGTVSCPINSTGGIQVSKLLLGKRILVSWWEKAPFKPCITWFLPWRISIFPACRGTTKLQLFTNSTPTLFRKLKKVAMMKKRLLGRYNSFNFASVEWFWRRLTWMLWVCLSRRTWVLWFSCAKVLQWDLWRSYMDQYLQHGKCHQ